MKDYIEQALKTNNTNYEVIKERLQDDEIIDLLHAGMGLCTEAGEFLDTIKKYIYYGKTLDEVNLVEEQGDIFWYSALALNILKTTFKEVKEKNIEKLKQRYPEKFTEEKAINRDLEKEREILEK